VKKAPAYTGPTKPTQKTGPKLEFKPKLKIPKPSGLY